MILRPQQPLLCPLQREALRSDHAALRHFSATSRWQRDEPLRNTVALPEAQYQDSAVWQSSQPPVSAAAAPRCLAQQWEQVGFSSLHGHDTPCSQQHPSAYEMVLFIHMILRAPKACTGRHKPAGLQSLPALGLRWEQELPLRFLTQLILSAGTSGVKYDL